MTPPTAGTISAITPQTVRKDRVNVFLDNQFAFAVAIDLIGEYDLRIGRRIEAADIERIGTADGDRKCRDAALTFLGSRPRSASEVRQRLRQKGFLPDQIEATIQWLAERNYLDDAAFADFWRENRQQFRPRGGRLIRAELAAKGVDREIARAVTADLDETDAAYRAAQPRANRFSGDEETFRRKIGQFLVRRGFGWETASCVVDRLWQERS